MNISELSTLLQREYNQLTPEGQAQFNRQFNEDKKSTGVMYALWFLFGFHYIYLGKWGTFILYFFTSGGLLIWMFADMFRIPSVTRKHNESLAIDIMNQVKMLEK